MTDRVRRARVFSRHGTWTDMLKTLDSGDDDSSQLEASLRLEQLRPGESFNLVHRTQGDVGDDTGLPTLFSGKLSTTPLDNASSLSGPSVSTHIELVRYGGDLAVSSRDEERLQDDLLRVLMTYLSTEPDSYASASYLDMVVQSTCLRGDPPSLHVSWAGQPAPIEVPADLSSGTESPLFGSRDMGAYEGGLYGGDHSHAIIRELENQPGASVLVLLSQRPLQILATEEVKRYDCCRVMCIEPEKEGTTLHRLRFYCAPHIGKFDDLVSSSDSILQQRNTSQYGYSTADRPDELQDAHTQSEILFKGVAAQVGNLYMALSRTFVSETDEAAASIVNRSGTTLVSGLISTDPCYQGHTNAIKDARLQQDLFYVWRNFSRFCETSVIERIKLHRGKGITV